jgi:hypothetical protein
MNQIFLCTRMMARPLANSILTYLWLIIFDYFLGADNTGMSCLGYYPRD